MTNYSSVIIDFDGTLFDTRRTISATIYETFAACKFPPPSRECIEALIGRGMNLEETLTHLMPQGGTSSATQASWHSLRSPALRSIVFLADLGRRPLHLLVCQSLVPYRRSFGGENQAPNSRPGRSCRNSRNALR
jgi:phosphoglycolate phosphatase-like HAD superfamily hydrolase